MANGEQTKFNTIAIVNTSSLQRNSEDKRPITIARHYLILINSLGCFDHSSEGKDLK